MNDQVNVGGNTYPLHPQIAVENTHAGAGEYEPILQFFEYAHLPNTLQEVSSPFAMLAEFVVNGLPRNAERSVALRKLLEAKDAAVRAAIAKPRSA